MKYQGFSTFAATQEEGVLTVTFDYVDTLARRIAKFPAASINACKQAVYESIDKPIDEALKAEAYWLYQATSKTPAIKRFAIAEEKGMEHDMENQRNWNDLVMQVQDIN